ncbi:type II secretion system major pseudopilin GspG [Pikeienuella piscinae]|uniref:Type II secretion system core protein G n=1 Tax=Pikeienuella piscinae TaxID=2748098 RepID=A0A7L5BYF2_9RHOB|nr:type II secretion system major pseudopilin GspG [Pikeienuella piscinae]QIE55266.1 type II secretion system major pseudopilin GspG [Pikeienuella piscinae]
MLFRRRLRRPNRRLRRGGPEAGYSLMEILIGLAIIALLIGVAGPRVFSLFERGKQKVATIQMEQLQAGLDLFRLDMRRYPTGEEGLHALIERPVSGAERWSGPYLDKASGLIDPWGTPYRYDVAGAGAYDLISYGADGAPGGDGENADIKAE